MEPSVEAIIATLADKDSEPTSESVSEPKLTGKSIQEPTIFRSIAMEVVGTLEEKNPIYGSAYEKVGPFLQLLYPNGIPSDRYSDMCLLVRVFDKMMRIATGDRTEEPWKDIAGYGILGQTTVKNG